MNIPSTIPPARQAANGVRHWTQGMLPEIQDRGDVYELPAGREGVPEHVRVIPKRWWGGGGEAVAIDSRGHELEVKAYPHSLVIVDARTGTTTTLDRDSLDLKISSALASQTRPIMSGCRVTTDCHMEEQIAASGDMQVRTKYHSVLERLEYGMVRDAPPNCTTVVAHDEDYRLTKVPMNGDVETSVVHKQRHQEPTVVGTLPSRVDQSGNLIITEADGHEETYPLFIPTHAINAR